MINEEQIIFFRKCKCCQRIAQNPLFDASEKLSYYCPCFSFSEIDARKLLPWGHVYLIHPRDKLQQLLAEEPASAHLWGNSPIGSSTTKTLLGQLIQKFVFGYASRVFLGKPTDQETNKLLYQELDITTPVLAISHQNEIAKVTLTYMFLNITQVNVFYTYIICQYPAYGWILNRKRFNFK